MKHFMERNGRRGLSLLLMIAVVLSLVISGSAHWANHSTRPTETYNTQICQIDGTAQTVTFTQSSAWTNELAGAAKVDLSFDGAEYVMKEIRGYDFALVFDGSSSPSESACKESAKVFVSNVITQNPDAHFTVIQNKETLKVYIQNSNNQSAVNAAITSVPWTAGVDFVQPGCEKAYDLHKASGRDTDLMIVIIGDGDWCYVPDSWTTSTGISFTTNYRGDSYSVAASRAAAGHLGISVSCTYNGKRYRFSTEGYYSTTAGYYEITKNGTIVEPANIQMRATWAKILYFNEFCQKELRTDGVVFASICVPKYDGEGRFNSYANTIGAFRGNITARYAADEGFNFEIARNNNAGYIEAFSELETAIMTRVVTLNTTIDNRYFTVDETALAAGLPKDCTYIITNTTRNGVAVQDVQILYHLMGSVALNVSVSIPVTINSDIPRAAFDSDKFLPVVYDGTSSDGAAGCLFEDLNGDQQQIYTRKVHINASNFLPPEYIYEYNINGGTGTTPAGGVVEVSTPTITLDSGAGLSRTGHILEGWLAATSAPAVIEADGTAPAGLLALGANYTLTDDSTFYAVWAVDSDGDGTPDYKQNKVIYNPGTMSGTRQIVLLADGQTSFVTAACPGTWTIGTGVFDGWRKADSSIIAAQASTVFAPDAAGGKTMTLTAVTSTNGRTAMDITVAITDAAEQTYEDGTALHSRGVTVTVTYRDGNTEVYDTPTKISDADITLKIESGKNLGATLDLSDDGQKFVASKTQPDGSTKTSAPSAQGISVKNTERKISLVVVGGDTATTDIVSVLDSSNQVVIKTNNTAQGTGTDGETYKIAQSSALNTTKYKLQGLYINGVDHTADFNDGMHEFVLTEDTSIYAIYHHDAQAGEYNLYANVISGVGTGTLQPRRDAGTYSNQPVSSALGKITYDNEYAATKMVAEGLFADGEYVAVALIPGSGYRVGSVFLNSEFISAGDEQWKTDSSGNVVITLPKDGNGDIVDATSYYLMVNYVKDTGSDYTVTISGKTYADGVEIPALGTGNEVYLSDGGYSETPLSIAYAGGTTVQFGARPGTDYEIVGITLDGSPVAIGSLMYHLILPPLDSDHDIVVTFNKKDTPPPKTVISALNPENEILRGNWAGESSGYVTFWLSADGNPFALDKLADLTIEHSKVLLWTSTSGDMHKLGTPALTGQTKAEGGNVYSEVRIPVTVHGSGVGAVTVKYEGGEIAVVYVITPGDCAEAYTGFVSAADITVTLRVVNRILPTPGAGYANNFMLEMMDMDKSKNISAVDITTMLRLANRISSI